MSMRGVSKTTQRVSVPASAADDLSSAARFLPAADVAAGVCGITPRAHAELELGFIYSGESDVSDSGITPEASRSPAVPRSFKELPSERTRDLHQSMFGSDDGYDYSSPRSTRASSHERVDDGASRHHSENRGTVEGNTSKRGDLKPWRLPEQLINIFSHATSQHHRISLFDASDLHGLSSSAKVLRAEEDFYLDAFFRHRWYNGNQKRDEASLLAAWNAFVQRVKNFGREGWLQKLKTVRVKFEKRTPTGARSGCIVCRVRQA